MVVMYHLGFSWMPGGFLGVEVFFVVSGYLITSLLLGEYESSLAEGGSQSGEHDRATISLRRFWARRARRLLPALGATLAGVVAFVAAAFTEELSDLWDQVAAAVLYVTNWLLIFQDQSYFETFGRPEALQHLWSLAIEEQFYLLWPIIFLGGMRWLRHRWFAVLVAIGVLVSTTAMWLLYEPLEDPSRIYYGTDTRAAGLLLGALLAFVWRPWLEKRGLRSRRRGFIFASSKTSGDSHSGIRLRSRRRSFIFAKRGINSKRSSQGMLPGITAAKLRPARDTPPRWLVRAANILGPAALAGVVGWCLYLGEFDERLYRGGFLLLAATTALLIAAVAVPGTWFGRAMDCAPLRWLGVRSYAIYLWHWPVLVFTRPRFDVTLDGWQLHLVRIGATLVLSDLSYRFIEHPIRTRQFKANFRNWSANARKSLRGYLVPLGAATALAVTVAVIVIPQVPTRNDPPVAETFILEVSESDRQVLGASQSGSNSGSANTSSANPGNANTDNANTGSANPNSTNPSSANPGDANSGDTNTAPELPAPEATISSSPPIPSDPSVSPETPTPAETSAQSAAGPSTSAETSAPAPTTSAPATSSQPESPGSPTTSSPATSSPPPTTAQEDAVFRATLPSGLPDPRLFAPLPGDWGDTAPTITAFGDSIMLGTRAYLELAFGDAITIDAEVSRQFSQLPDTIADYKSDPDNPPLGDVVIIHLGTNGFLNSRVFDETMEQLETTQRVLFVNVRVPRTWEDEVNRQLSAGVERWDNAYLVDWHGYSAGQEEDWINPTDGVHMVPEGALAYTQLLQASL